MLGRFRSAIYNAIGTVEVEPGTPAIPGLLGSADTGRGGKFGSDGSNGTLNVNKVKYAYQRPIFLQLFTDDEIQVTADHLVRPIMVPRDVHILPWFAGYAEAINAGKSLRNEDQAAFHRGVLRTQDLPDDEQYATGIGASRSTSEMESKTGENFGAAEHFDIPYVYFGIFDGHAGSGCAVTAANELHQVIHKRLMGVLLHLLQQARGAGTGILNGAGGEGASSVMWFPNREISIESMVIGALESAFWEMDQQIGEDKRRYKMLGGCTVLVSVFILGKLYVANAGDSRGVLCRNKVAYPMSFDFTPVSERQRLQQLGYQKPHLLGSEYTHFDFCRRPLRKDVGKRMLYRDAHMTGWAYKEIQPDDLKFPVVYGEGKRSRLLATIGVTRGFGDHDLRAQSSNAQTVYIKPFLTPQPEVRVLDIENEDISESDVLVMATDGLWDVISNERVADIINNGMVLHSGKIIKSATTSALSNSDEQLLTSQGANLNQSKKLIISDEVRKKYRFISIAQELVMAARGKLVERNWRRSVPVENGQTDHTEIGNGSTENLQNQLVPATIDDISVFVIPILAYKEEYLAWKTSKFSAKKKSGPNQGNILPNETEKTEVIAENGTENPNTLANRVVDKNENQLSDTSDSELELDNNSTTLTNSLCDTSHEVNTTLDAKVESGDNTSLGVLEDNLSIEDALDAIIQEEDMSANSKATLEIKETDEENDNSDEDDAEKH